MDTLFRLLPGPQPLLVRYGATLVLVIFAFLIRFEMGDGTGRYGFIHFVLPIVAAAVLFGRGAGAFAIALSVGLVASLLQWDTHVGSHLSAMGVFVIVGTCLVLLAEGLRAALTKAHAAQEATELLLQEMSHRVRNKFAMISSIIGLQARDASPEVKHALEDVAARVNVMATVHNYLQLSRHDGSIDMSVYVPRLCHALRDALCGPRPIKLVVRSDPVRLLADKALTTGLILNELVTNAFKYAFEPDRSGELLVEVAEVEGVLEIAVTDNGDHFEPGERKGLGTRLVTVLAAQLGGTAEWSRTESGGCNVHVMYPYSEPKMDHRENTTVAVG